MKMYKYLTSIDAIDSKAGGVNPGTNILVSAPAFSDGELVASILSRPQRGEYMLVLSLENQAVELNSNFSALGFPMDHIGIIDAISKGSSGEQIETTKLKYITSPNDLTGMDIKFSQLTEDIMKGEFTDDPNQMFPTPIRYCVLSLTSLLMFRKVDVVYHFLHVVSSKLKKIGSIGIFLINNESFDAKTISIIKQLMNMVVEIKNDDVGNSMRIQGGFGLSMNWKHFNLNDGKIIFEP